MTEPRPVAGKELALALVMLLAGGAIFALFSFMTFGVPLMVLAVAALIWMYVGIMRWIDSALTKRLAPRHPNGKSR